jgi:hypothetical protein
MALWDSYLAGESWWAVKTNWSVYGMIRDAGRLMDDARFKGIGVTHMERIAKRRFGSHIELTNVFQSLFPPSACWLRGSSSDLHYEKERH